MYFRQLELLTQSACKVETRMLLDTLCDYLFIYLVILRASRQIPYVMQSVIL